MSKMNHSKILGIKKQGLLGMSFYLWVFVLAGCGSPHPVSLSPKSFILSGSHEVGTFKINRVELNINGFSSKTVKKKEAVAVQAVIKYQGSGMFQARWLLDGQVVEQVNSALNRGSLLTLKSKKIKTSLVGRHRIQLKIIQPINNFKIPELTLFVVQ